MKRVSVIIPVYNSEKYLVETLDSVAAQTYSDIEVILIDDGSTDRSGQICKERVEMDNRFRYYRVKNGGPGIARNTGITYASGEYIGFCDSDDLIKPDMYQTMVTYMERNAADIVFCDIYSERDRQKFGFPWPDGTVFQSDEIGKTLVAAFVGNETDNDSNVPLWGSVVRCLFKKEIIQDGNISFPTDIHFAEDMIFTIRYLAKASSAVICDQVFYRYRANETSIMFSFFSYKENMFRDRLKLVDYVNDVIQEFSQNDSLSRRLCVTERCYFRECVGNACRKRTNRTKTDIEAELKYILNHPEVRRVFRSFSVSNPKTWLIYMLIKFRLIKIIQLYYSVRFR